MGNWCNYVCVALRCSNLQLFKEYKEAVYVRHVLLLMCSLRAISCAHLFRLATKSYSNLPFVFVLIKLEKYRQTLDLYGVFAKLTWLNVIFGIP